MPLPQLLTTFAEIGLGMVVGGYWYRVMRLAMKARRRIGRAANLVPPEPLAALRLLWAPAIMVWIVHPFLSALVRPLPGLLSPLGALSASAASALNVAALIVAGGCLAATTVCWRKMGTSWRMGINPGETTQLVASGPFAYVRHPIYALSVLMMFATAAAIRSPLMLAVASVHIGLIVWESVREEQYLLAVHGETYGRYQRSVGRFVPVSCRPFQSDPDKLPSEAAAK